MAAAEAAAEAADAAAVPAGKASKCSEKQQTKKSQPHWGLAPLLDGLEPWPGWGFHHSAVMEPWFSGGNCFKSFAWKEKGTQKEIERKRKETRGKWKNMQEIEQNERTGKGNSYKDQEIKVNEQKWNENTRQCKGWNVNRKMWKDVKGCEGKRKGKCKAMKNEEK